MDDFPKTRVIRIPPFFYLHVLNRNTNVTRLEVSLDILNIFGFFYCIQVGPQTFVCKEHERVVFGPDKMLIIPYERTSCNLLQTTSLLCYIKSRCERRT